MMSMHSNLVDDFAGTYNMPSGLGRQVTKKSLPVTAFGRAGRDASSKLYLSPEHDKASSGTSPGPTTAAQLPAFRRQQLSNKMNAPAVGFARSARQAYPVRPGPGPGTWGLAVRDDRPHLTCKMFDCQKCIGFSSSATSNNS